MAQEELFGTRDRSYSAWHRRKSTQRFVGIESAQTLAMIDLDASLYVEYDDASKEPLALIETAVDTGQAFKTATVTKKLAALCTERVLPAYVLLYKLSSERLASDEDWFDIESFRYKMIHPQAASDWTTCTPEEWANNLVRLRKWSAALVDRQLKHKIAERVAS